MGLPKGQRKTQQGLMTSPGIGSWNQMKGFNWQSLLRKRMAAWP